MDTQDDRDHSAQSLSDVSKNLLQGLRHSTPLTPSLQREELQKEVVLDRQVRLFAGCFRRGEGDDPEVFMEACRHIFKNYSPEIVQQVIDPHNGLPSKQNFFPTAHEIKQAFDDALAPQRRAAFWKAKDEEVRRQFAEREAYEQQRASNPRKEEVEAKLKAAGYWRDHRGKLQVGAPPVRLTVGQFCEKYGITKEQFDAIPNQSADFMATHRIEPLEEEDEQPGSTEPRNSEVIDQVGGVAVLGGDETGAAE